MNKYLVVFKTPKADYSQSCTSDKNLQEFSEYIKFMLNEISERKSGLDISLQNNKIILLPYQVLLNTVIEITLLQGDK